MTGVYLPIINIIITLVTVIVGIAVAWGSIKEKIKVFESKMNELRSSIYKSNGTNVYVTKEDCNFRVNSFIEEVKSIDKKLDDVIANVVELKTKMELFISK